MFSILRRLQEEVDRVIGDKDFVTYEDLSNMEYMSMVSTIRYFVLCLGVFQVKRDHIK